ncbi:TrkA C-terminal domain-containing protein [Pectinatus brassicae]|uniref:K+/H+ antiporter YhaU regulatory subunit KhtT n=1 Tax=Pectinatus brassicae TaxID=862415 RepID=A0A840UUW6_9FIRM|nr:TrkA C-terminal domain-containing protein [Pectinatus brassicae]MBB5336604.1 K+/H+ antiporter YhaU regulatory subunit KhtT [Pectinatus brassicae]
MHLPVYQTIAVDLATRITEYEFLVGAKLSGRTLLASQYSVSPETIRKAVVMLKDAGVVQVSQGREILVISRECAAKFLTHQKQLHSVYSLRQELELLLKEKEDIDTRFRKVTTEIASYSDRLKNIQPYNPLEIIVTAESGLEGKTLRDLAFREMTGTLVIAVRRDKEMFIAPDPNIVLWKDDRLVVIGAVDKLEKLNAFFAGNNKKLDYCS